MVPQEIKRSQQVQDSDYYPAKNSNFHSHNFFFKQITNGLFGNISRALRAFILGMYVFIICHKIMQKVRGVIYVKKRKKEKQFVFVIFLKNFFKSY